MATIPSLVIVLARFFTHDEPMILGKALGCLAGFVGVIALIGVDALKGLGEVVIGQIAILAGETPSWNALVALVLIRACLGRVVEA